MNRKTQLKFLIFIAATLIIIPLSLIGVTLLAQFITYFQQGADPASIFRGNTLLIPEDEQIRWLSIDNTREETPSRAEQEEIIAAYWLAWQALDRAQQTGDTSDMATYWSGAAYQQALQGLDRDRTFTRTHSDHKLMLSFFSEDGSVVAFTDESFSMSYTTGERSVQVTASAEVVMTLDQGFWRVRSILINYNI